MKLKDLDLTNVKTITIYLHIGNNVFAVNCDKLSFNFFHDIDLDVEGFFSSLAKHVDIFMSYGKSDLNDVLSLRLLNIAFDRKLSVLGEDANLISKRDFASILLGNFGD